MTKSKIKGEAVSDGCGDFPTKEDETKIEHNAMFKAWVMNQKNYSLIHVDMASKLQELGLKDFFPMTRWPPAAAVRVCASDLLGLASVDIVPSGVRVGGKD